MTGLGKIGGRVFFEFWVFVARINEHPTYYYTKQSILNVHTHQTVIQYVQVIECLDNFVPSFTIVLGNGASAFKLSIQQYLQQLAV